MSDNVIQFPVLNETSTQEEISLPTIVDMQMEEFKKFCVGKNATYLLSLRNLLATTFAQVETNKNALVDKMVNDESLKADQMCKTTLGDLYILLQDLEDKVAYIRSIFSTSTS